MPELAIALDGGTISFVVDKGSGERETIFLDRRMSSETKNVFYAGKYPGLEGSVALGKNPELVAKLEILLTQRW